VPAVCNAEVHQYTPPLSRERTIARWSDMTDYEETLRSLALNDDRFVALVLGMGQDTIEVSQLDPKSHALVRLGALHAIDAAPASYHASVEAALAAGASFDEIVGVLIAVAPVVGLARVVSAAPDLALALGYDVNAALEAQG
jgi:alkylhydroperoxidase/carboxymuconolactone decarboxylase family protein YurZ